MFQCRLDRLIDIIGIVDEPHIQLATCHGKGLINHLIPPCATYMHFIWFTIIDIKAGVHLTECNWLYLLIHALNITHTLSQIYHCSSNSDQTLKNRNLPHMPLCISMISGVCMLGMWNGQVKCQVTEMHRLKVNGHCDKAFFISMCGITLEPRHRPLIVTLVTTSL